MCTEWARAYGRVCVCKRESCCCGPPSLWKCCCWGLFLRRPYCCCFLSSHSSSPRNYFSRMWARREFLLSPYRCFWIYMLILWAKNYIKNLAAILFCVFACMRVFFCIAQGNKCPLSLSKCQISYQHLPACCCDIYAHTHTDTYTHTAGVQHYSGTHKTGWSNTVYIFIKVKVKNLAFEWNASFVVERAQVCALLRSLASHCLRVYCMR